MAEQMRPASKELAPDPAQSYERAHPSKEAGMGRMDNNQGTPAKAPDSIEAAVKNKQDLRQINADEVQDGRDNESPDSAVNQRPGAESEQEDEQEDEEEE